ncbi:MAG: lysophospholipid acyltransferase family protein [Candidatus Afipia apatlaquensis]|uniref:Lysophospholipid acyltransferase family protein n=1 Tax=Candidatus Afipia apatlaquensis TaxID=2712852 RepID=A0A7C9RGJ7_9BRAD|nr:lysophospholipid acyltransferase family protein [Candidatus Afipia apatlaquensis]
MKRFLRDLGRSSWVQRAAGTTAAEFLRFVWWTNRFTLDPPNVYKCIEPDMPVIIAFWHGQHFMMPFLKLKQYSAKVLISRHRDGEINAIAAERLNVGTVRGSGDHGTEFHRKGGVGAFKMMLRTLEDNINMALTADVPKVARKAGLGIIMLARESGRPILPVAIATSRFKRLNNWDRSVIHLPFGRGVIAAGEILWVPPDADTETMQKLRLQLEERLNDVTRRAYDLVGLPNEGLHA